MFDRYDQSLRVLMKKYAEYGADPDILDVPHRNMLKRAVLLFYQAGHIDKALQIYNTLRKEYPTDKEIQGSLTEYARDRLIGELTSIGFNDATEIITLMLQEAYYRYALHDDDEAFGREKMAREVYDYYQKQFGDEGVDRVVLPDFDIMRYVGLNGFMSDSRYPEDLRQNLVDRIRIERPELYEKMKQQQEVIMQQMQNQENTQQ
jgi:hypothetical protein